MCSDHVTPLPVSFAVKASVMTMTCKVSRDLVLHCPDCTSYFFPLLSPLHQPRNILGLLLPQNLCICCSLYLEPPFTSCCISMWLVPSLPSGLSSKLTFSARASLTTHLNFQHLLSPFSTLLFCIWRNLTECIFCLSHSLSPLSPARV